MQYRGGVQYRRGYHDACGGYLEYRMGMFSTVGDILSTVGVFSTVGGYQGSLIFTGRGGSRKFGDQVLFLDQKGDQKIFSN